MSRRIAGSLAAISGGAWQENPLPLLPLTTTTIAAVALTHSRTNVHSASNLPPRWTTANSMPASIALTWSGSPFLIVKGGATSPSVESITSMSTVAMRDVSGRISLLIQVGEQPSLGVEQFPASNFDGNG